VACAATLARPLWWKMLFMLCGIWKVLKRIVRESLGLNSAQPLVIGATSTWRARAVEPVGARKARSLGAPQKAPIVGPRAGRVCPRRWTSDLRFAFSPTTIQDFESCLCNTDPSVTARMSAPPLLALLQLFVLGPLAYIIDLAAAPVSNLYPFPLATTLHAARVALAYKGRVKALGFDGAMKARGRGVEWAGYLVMVSRISPDCYYYSYIRSAGEDPSSRRSSNKLRRLSCFLLFRGSTTSPPTSSSPTRASSLFYPAPQSSTPSSPSSTASPDPSQSPVQFSPPRTTPAQPYDHP
jgi:hypothetical protein